MSVGGGASGAAGLTGRVGVAVGALSPSYFALVMATGIVSVAAYLLGWRPIAYALVAVNLLAYPALWALTLTRAVAYRQRFLADVVDHARGSGFFTTIAGTNVLGAQLFIVLGWRSTAEGLFVLGVLLWFVVMYTFFTSIIVRRKKPTLVEGINGAWLIATVATESVAILAVLLRTPLGLPAQDDAEVSALARARSSPSSSIGSRSCASTS